MTDDPQRIPLEEMLRAGRGQILPYAQPTFAGPLDEVPEIVRCALVIYESVSGVSPTDALYLLKEAEERPENLRALETENESLRTQLKETWQDHQEAVDKITKLEAQLKLARRQLDDRAEQFRKADGQRDLLVTVVKEIVDSGKITRERLKARLQEHDEDLYEQIVEAG